MCGPTVQLGFACVLTAAALLLVALSFSTDHWVDVTVNRSKLKGLAVTNTALNTSLYSDKLYFTRHRGLFRTCYPGRETVFLDKAPHVVDASCLVQQGYEIPQRELTANWSNFYQIRIHLLRCHVAFFILAMFLQLICCVLGAVGCWRVSPRVLKSTALLAFLGAFFTAGGMAFFHGYEYLEKQKIGDSTEFPAKWNTMSMYTELKANYRAMYGWSYILGWLGMGLSSLAAILYLCSAFSIQDAHKIIEKKRLRDAQGDDFSTLGSGKPRNRAYEYADRGNPPPTGYDNPYASQGYPYGYDYNGTPAYGYDAGYRY